MAEKKSLGTIPARKGEGRGEKDVVLTTRTVKVETPAKAPATSSTTISTHAARTRETEPARAKPSMAIRTSPVEPEQKGTDAPLQTHNLKKPELSLETPVPETPKEHIYKVIIVKNSEDSK